MGKQKKMKNQPWRNDWVCVIYYKGEVRRCYAETQRHMLIRMPDAAHRKWGVWCNMNTDTQQPVGDNYWKGYTFCARTGGKLHWELYYRGNQVKEAARLLGQIGGQNGVGKKKVRGDSNYYRMLQLKGALAKRKKKRGLKEKGKELKNIQK